MRDKSGDFMKALPALEARVVKLADLATTSHEPPDPVSGFDPKEHGHATLASLFAEWRQDEAARKEPSGLVELLTNQILHGPSELPEADKEQGHGIER